MEQLFRNGDLRPWKGCLLTRSDKAPSGSFATIDANNANRKKLQTGQTPEQLVSEAAEDPA
jgi:hypothetical protein